MEKHLCVVCCKQFDTGAILLNTRLHDIPKEKAITGYGMCPEHTKMDQDGYVAMIECNSHLTANGEPANATNCDRTGRFVHVRRHVAEQIFGQSVSFPVAIIDTKVIPYLQSLETEDVLSAKVPAPTEY